MDKEAIEFLVTAQKKREITVKPNDRTSMMFVKVTCTPLSQLKMREFHIM